MCFYIPTKQKRKPEPLTATQDIKVYKVLSACNVSPYFSFRYRPNTLYRLRKKLKPIKANGIIRHVAFRVFDGFHTFSCYDRAYDFQSNLLGEIIVTAIIPKGAKYFVGGMGDIVSTSLRMGNMKPLQGI